MRHSEHCASLESEDDCSQLSMQHNTVMSADGGWELFARTWSNSVSIMPDLDSLRMNETRRVEKRNKLERLGDTLWDDLELFVETGSTDRSMCNDVRVQMDRIKGRWEEVSKDFKQLLATMVDGEVRENTLEAQDAYRTAYIGGIKKAGEATADLFNTMETERLDREARRGGGGQGQEGGGGGGLLEVLLPVWMKVCILSSRHRIPFL